MILLDTNIVIAYFRGEDSVVKWIKRCRNRGEEFCISTVTIVELFSFSEITDEEIDRMMRWFEIIFVIDVDQMIAIRASEIRRKNKLTTTDSMIATSAFLSQASIATRDKAFQKLKIRVIVP